MGTGVLSFAVYGCSSVEAYCPGYTAAPVTTPNGSYTLRTIAGLCVHGVHNVCVCACACVCACFSNLSTRLLALCLFCCLADQSPIACQVHWHGFLHGRILLCSWRECTLPCGSVRSSRRRVIPSMFWYVCDACAAAWPWRLNRSGMCMAWVLGVCVVCRVHVCQGLAVLATFVGQARPPLTQHPVALARPYTAQR